MRKRERGVCCFVYADHGDDDAAALGVRWVRDIRGSVPNTAAQQRESSATQNAHNRSVERSREATAHTSAGCSSGHAVSALSGCRPRLVLQCVLLLCGSLPLLLPPLHCGALSGCWLPPSFPLPTGLLLLPVSIQCVCVCLLWCFPSAVGCGCGWSDAVAQLPTAAERG